MKQIRKIALAASMLLTGSLTPWAPIHAQTVPQTLTFAVNTFGGEQLDPVVAKAELINILAIMFDSLWETDAKGQIQPGLIDKWEVSPDAKVWTLHLRTDVVFHDGSPFTADDVVYTLQHSMVDEAQRGGLWKETLGNPPKLEVLDKYTVRVTTPKPQPNMPALSNHVATPFMFVLPKAYIEKNGIDYFKKHPVGTGPYKFAKLVPGQEMDFEAVDYKHWRVNPSFKTLKFLEVPEETTRAGMLETGQIDATNLTPENALRLQKEGFRLVKGEVAVANVNLIGSYLPEAKGMPTADLRVRQALSLAINRQELVDTILSGLGSADVVNIGLDWTTPDWTPELQAKWKPLLQKAYRYDPAEAKRLIAEAGYPNGFDFTYWVPPESSTPWLPDLMQAIASYWNAVGARVKLVTVDANAWRGVRHTKTSKQLVGSGGAGALGVRNIAVDSFKFFTSNLGNMNVLVGSPLEAQLDALYVKSQSSADRAENAKLFDQLLDISVNSWTSWPIVMSQKVIAVGPRADGDVSRDSLNPAYNFAYWKYTGKK